MDMTSTGPRRGSTTELGLRASTAIGLALLGTLIPALFLVPEGPAALHPALFQLLLTVFALSNGAAAVMVWRAASRARASAWRELLRFACVAWAINILLLCLALELAAL